MFKTLHKESMNEYLKEIIDATEKGFNWHYHNVYVDAHVSLTDAAYLSIELENFVKRKVSTFFHNTLGVIHVCMCLVQNIWEVTRQRC